MNFSKTDNPFYITEGSKGKYWLVKIPGGFFPDAIYNGTSEGQIRAKLRRNLKKPELTKTAVIERISPTTARKWYRAHAKDLEGIEEDISRKVEKLKTKISMTERKLDKMSDDEVITEGNKDDYKWNDINKALTRSGKNASQIKKFIEILNDVEKEARNKPKGRGNNQMYSWESINTALTLYGFKPHHIIRFLGKLPK